MLTGQAKTDINDIVEPCLMGHYIIPTLLGFEYTVVIEDEDVNRPI